jgi:hypothetical protein
MVRQRTQIFDALRGHLADAETAAKMRTPREKFPATVAGE